MSRLREVLEAGVFAVTGEVGPPKGVNVGAVLEEAKEMAPHVVAVNVTDLQSAVMRVSSLATCKLLLERGIEPVLQLTCRDRNRLALQAELLGAAVFGIKNALLLTGDHMVLGDHPEARPVFDLDSVQLLKAASELKAGRDLSGHELDGTPDLFIGAVATPEFEPLELHLIKMRKKVEAGAQFFQTQAVYDVERFKQFADAVSGWGVPILAGIVLLKSAGMARYMNQNVAGVRVPQELIDEMSATPKEKRREKSAEIALRIVEQIRPYCAGVHIMPLGWADVAAEVAQQINKKTRQEVESRIHKLQSELEDLKARIPAHSAPPDMLLQQEKLEDQIKRLRALMPQ